MTSTPFMQGSQAFMNEASTSSCTFPQGSTMQREWIEGWSQRQVQERAHRSRAFADMHLEPNLGGHASATRPTFVEPAPGLT